MRGLSHLPVMPGKEAEVLNREIFPALRELQAVFASLNTLTTQSLARLDEIEDSIGDFSGLATSGPTDVGAGDLRVLGTSLRAAKEDHGHAVRTAAPTVGIGIGNSEGVSPALAKADHGHVLRETSGPTDLPMGDIFAGEMWRRFGGAIVGRILQASNSNGTATSSVVTPADVSSSLNFALKDTSPTVYYAIWVLFYTSAAATTGLMLSVNFTGTTSGNDRYGVLMATGAGTTFSAYSTTFDTLLGTATVGPGSTGRMALVFARVAVAAGGAGTLALRYASGVASSAVSITAQSFGIVLQQ